MQQGGSVVGATYDDRRAVEPEAQPPALAAERHTALVVVHTHSTCAVRHQSHSGLAPPPPPLPHLRPQQVVSCLIARPRARLRLYCCRPSRLTRPAVSGQTDTCTARRAGGPPLQPIWTCVATIAMGLPTAALTDPGVGRGAFVSQCSKGGSSVLTAKLTEPLEATLATRASSRSSFLDLRARASPCASISSI